MLSGFSRDGAAEATSGLFSIDEVRTGFWWLIFVLCMEGFNTS